jgi:hypothetical protein
VSHQRRLGVAGGGRGGVSGQGADRAVDRLGLLGGDVPGGQRRPGGGQRPVQRRGQLHPGFGLGRVIRSCQRSGAAAEVAPDREARSRPSASRIRLSRAAASFAATRSPVSNAASKPASDSDHSGRPASSSTAAAIASSASATGCAPIAAPRAGISAAGAAGSSSMGTMGMGAVVVFMAQPYPRGLTVSAAARPRSPGGRDSVFACSRASQVWGVVLWVCCPF